MGQICFWTVASYWLDMAGLGRTRWTLWTRLDPVGPCWTQLDSIRLDWTWLDQIGPDTTQLEQIGPKVNPGVSPGRSLHYSL